MVHGEWWDYINKEVTAKMSLGNKGIEDTGPNRPLFDPSGRTWLSSSVVKC
jgi:hypothetical protein